MLREGKAVALISDAGTPALNDPGYELVRAALDAGFLVSPVPGPSAPIAALVASGLPTDSFLYLGYLPRKSSARRKSLAQVKEFPYTLIFLESPNRLLGALIDLEDILGNRLLNLLADGGSVGDSRKLDSFSDRLGGHLEPQSDHRISLLLALREINERAYRPKQFATLPA